MYFLQNETKTLLLAWMNQPFTPVKREIRKNEDNIFLPGVSIINRRKKESVGKIIGYDLQ